MSVQVVRHPKTIVPSKVERYDREKIKDDLLIVLQRELDALRRVMEKLPREAMDLVELVLTTTGRIVFSGMGKSGHIAKKLVATFSSLGTPAVFLHPSEALHGDLGMVQHDDLLVALSKSGTGKELEQVITALRLQGNRVALICCSRGILALMTDLVVELPFEREACDLDLAPTSSSTAMIAFGDAVAVAVSKARGFTRNDFAKTHPAGALGRKLLSTVQAFMHSGDDLPFVSPTDSFQEVVVKATSKKLGAAIVVDDAKDVCGIVTDGDLRRACELGAAVFDKKVCDIMTKNPKKIEVYAKAHQALETMEQFAITVLVVVNESKKVVGLVHIHDLVKAGIKS